MTTIRSWAAPAPHQALVSYTYDAGDLGAEEVEVAVEHCGVCHSDLSLINNEWGNARYPLVPGHEIIGRITALGAHTKGLSVGQRVGIGWISGSCMHCQPCLGGDQHLCGRVAPTIVKHHGGFAEAVRAHWAWVLPLPEALDAACAGPLLCGGITVFAPFVEYNIPPTARVGVVGIGGLGHMALQFAAAWGCEVTAFTSSESKTAEALALGAHHVVSSHDKAALRSVAGTLDLLLVTVNVPLNWQALIATLAPKGRLHLVGAVLEPIPVAAFDLIGRQRSISGSPTGSPVVMAQMLAFAARHHIKPQVERFPMSEVNAAIAHLESGKARYRVVLDADFE